MRMVIVGFLFLVFGGSLAQAANLSQSIFDYAVVSAEDIRSRECDIQGSVVAGRNIEFFNFGLGNELTEAEQQNTRLISGGNFTFTNGSNALAISSVDGNATFDSVVQSARLQVAGRVDFSKVSLPDTLEVVRPEAPRLHLSDVNRIQTVAPFSHSAEIGLLVEEMQGRSACYARLRANPLGWQGSPGRYQFVVFRGIPGQAVNVYNVEKSTWDAANGLKFIGDKSMKFVVNVRGSVVNMVRKGFLLEGGVQLNQILLNFHEAKQITVSQSGTDKGVPTLFAPAAQLRHSSNLISGGIFVRDYDGWYADQCGQVNRHATDRFVDPDLCR